MPPPEVQPGSLFFPLPYFLHSFFLYSRYFSNMAQAAKSSMSLGGTRSPRGMSFLSPFGGCFLQYSSLPIRVVPRSGIVFGSMDRDLAADRMCSLAVPFPTSISSMKKTGGQSRFDSSAKGIIASSLPERAAFRKQPPQKLKTFLNHKVLRCCRPAPSRTLPFRGQSQVSFFPHLRGRPSRIKPHPLVRVFFYKLTDSVVAQGH